MSQLESLEGRSGDGSDAVPPERPVPALPGNGLADLRRERARRLKWIRKDRFASGLRRVLARALQRHLPALGSAEVTAILQEVVRDAMTLVQDEGRSIRGISKDAFLRELERSRDQTLLERDRARAELAALQGRAAAMRRALERERTEFVQRESNRAAGTDRELRDHLRDLFVEAADGRISMEQLREAVLRDTLHAVQDERLRVYEERAAEQRKQIETYERRVAKLNALLETTEKALDPSWRAELERGLASGYREVQGLAPDAALAALKERLLSRLFLVNLDLMGR